MKINLALAQFNTQLGNVQANLQKHLELIDQAVAQDADVLIFPELSLTGYALQDQAIPAAIRPHQEDPVFYALLEASQKLDLMVGFVHEDRRHKFYIAAAYLSAGRILHIHNKV